jgi:hypothetical protein
MFPENVSCFWLTTSVRRSSDLRLQWQMVHLPPGDRERLLREGCDLRLVAGYEGGHLYHHRVYLVVFLSSTTKAAL